MLDDISLKKNQSNSHPRESVVRGSETQLHVGKKLGAQMLIALNQYFYL